MEYWFTPTIVNSVVPFACPIEVDPVCLTGVDYSAVLVSVKSHSLTDVPHFIPIHGFSGLGAIATCLVVRSQETPHDRLLRLLTLPPTTDNMGGGGRDEDGGDGDFPSGIDQDLAAPPPPVRPHLDDLVVQLPGGGTMLANHQPLVFGVPITSRPKAMEVKLFRGFYDVRVTGNNGEHGFFRIPMRPAGSPKLIVANFASCSIGYRQGGYCGAVSRFIL